MKRRLFTLAAAVSLVMCVASVALSIRSAWRFDSITIVTRHNTFYEFYATTGPGIQRIRDWPESPGIRHLQHRLRLSEEEIRRGYIDPSRTKEFPLIFYSQFGGAFTRGWYRWGFGISSGAVCVAVDESGQVQRGITSLPPGGLASIPLSAPLPYWKVDIPYAAPVVATAIIPLWICFRTVRSRALRWLRTRRGQCIACGYDLRATPERCPECGSVPRASGRARMYT